MGVKMGGVGLTSLCSSFPSARRRGTSEEQMKQKVSKIRHLLCFFGAVAQNILPR